MIEHRLDFERGDRCGFPEFIYGEGKTAEQLIAIFSEFETRGLPVMATRVTPEKARVVMTEVVNPEYDEVSGVLMGSVHRLPPLTRSGKPLIVTAGTSDLSVAKLCAATLRFCGWQTEVLCDAGVAGLHRLLAQSDLLGSADVIIVIAGMEGALPSVVGGLVAVPIIAVPTSVGYGAGLHGFTALMGMLSSCAAGVTVVNIDNGFGAACAAIRILNHKN